MKIKFFLLTLLFACLMAGDLSAQLVCAAPGIDGDVTSLSGQVNTYFPGSTTTLAAGATTVTIGSSKGAATGIAAGDLILIIQMQGVDINSSNSSSYGNGGSNGRGYLTTGTHFFAGRFEFVTATNSVGTSGGTLQFSPALTHSYEKRSYSSGSNGKSTYQVIRVPQYKNVTLTANVTAYKWDGTVGGVIAMDVSENLNFNAKTINAAAAGFRGGGGRNLSGGTGSNTDFRTLSTVNNNGQKGEGFAGTPAYVWNGVDGTSNVISTGSEGYPNGSSSRGAPGNAGGGAQDANPAANDQNAGSGGGGNGGNGGRGGNSWNSNSAVGGRGGSAFSQASISRLVMGGGGGAGNGNNSGTHPDALSGAPGGGIVIIKAGTVSGTGTISVNGQNAQNVSPDGGDDGGGAGGAGGSVLFTASVTSGMSGVTVSANGGKGGSTSQNAGDHGPGGGGGGGVIFSNGTLNSASRANGGANGTTNGNQYNAQSGANGILSQSAANDPSNAYSGYRCLAILPITGLNLSGAVKNNEAKLQWTTINEINTDYFEVERSFDGENFTAIGLRTPAAGYSDIEQTYSVRDDLGQVSVSGVVYYRVKSVDIDGSISFSNIISLSLSQVKEIKVWPNPFTNKVTVNLGGRPTSRMLLIKLSDLSGRTIWQKEESVGSGGNHITITALDKLPSGVYLLTIVDRLSKEKTEIKLIKNGRM